MWTVTDLSRLFSQDWLADSGRLHRVSELLLSAGGVTSVDTLSAGNPRPSSGSFGAVVAAEASAAHGGVPLLHRVVPVELNDKIKVTASLIFLSMSK